MVYNKLNFLILALIPADKANYNSSIFHLTDKLTEVTNGHYLIRVEAPNVSKGDVPVSKLHRPMKKSRVNLLISRDSAAAVLQAIPKNGTIPIVQNAWLGANTKGDQVEFITTDLETWRPIVTRVVDGKFPATDRLLKDNRVNRKKWRTNVWFSPEYMKKICDLYEKTGVKAIKLSIGRPDGPMRLMAMAPDTNQLVTTLLMPMKGFEGSLEKPKKERKKKPEEGKPKEASEAETAPGDNAAAGIEGIDT